MSNKRGTPLDAHLARKRPFIAARDAPLSSQSYNRASSGLAESVNVVVERPAPPDSLTSLREGLFINNKTVLDELNIELDNTKAEATPARHNIDQKKIKEPEVQRRYCATIKAHLRETNYDGIEPATSRNISSPEFQAVFKYLISRIMPKYVFSKRFEDEVMDVLRILKCPLLNIITAATLRSIGTLHAHPTFFALLFWLTECSKQLDLSREALEEQTDYENPILIFHQFAIDCYRSHQSGNDDFTEQTNKLRTKCDDILALRQSQVSKLESEIGVLRKKIADTNEVASRLEEEKNKNTILNEDMAKYQTYIARTKARSSQYKEMNSRLKNEIEGLEVALRNTKSEIAETENKWAARHITLNKVIDANNELEKAQNNYTSITQKLNETKKENSSLKEEIVKCEDGIEAKVEDYNSILTGDRPLNYNRNQTKNNDLENEILSRMVEKKKALKAEILELGQEVSQARATLNEVISLNKKREKEIEEQEKELSRQKIVLEEANKTAQSNQTHFKTQVEDDNKSRRHFVATAMQSLNDAREKLNRRKIECIAAKDNTKKVVDEINEKLQVVIETITRKFAELEKIQGNHENVMLTKIQGAMNNLNIEY